MQEVALQVPGVKAAESWAFNTARRIRPDGRRVRQRPHVRFNADSPLVHPTLVEGRWLVPGDQKAVVVNTLMLKNDPDVKVGDEITLKMSGDETKWSVVGIMKGTPPIAMAYVNYPYFARTMGYVGRSPVLFTVTDAHDAASQARMAQALEDRFEALGMGVSSTQTSATERAQIQAQFNVLVIFLLIMAVLLAVVGGIGLMGTMSLNVLERTREIGVMRAVGATGAAISGIVIVEGVLIGLISWAIGVLIAYPLSIALCNMVGNSILRSPLSYIFSIPGALLWLGIALVLASLASLLPARSASRISVREVLRTKSAPAQTESQNLEVQPKALGGTFFLLQTLVRPGVIPVQCQDPGTALDRRRGQNGALGYLSKPFSARYTVPRRAGCAASSRSRAATSCGFQHPAFSFRLPRSCHPWAHLTRTSHPPS
jgi:putative ABC transport system permease protein